MTLQQRILLVSGGIGVAVVFVMVAAVWNGPHPALTLLCAAGVVAIMFTSRVCARRTEARAHAAFADGRANEARRLFRELAVYEGGTRESRAWHYIAEAAVLCLERKFAEARSLLEHVDVRGLPPHLAGALSTNLAWATAHAGDPQRAIAIAERALPPRGESERPSRAARAGVRGALGAAHVLAGNWAEGARELRIARALGGTPAQQAARAFYLGEALRALGQHADARRAYEDAARTGGDTEKARLAKARLEAAGGTPFRS